MMTITLEPEQEAAIQSAIQRGVFRSVEDFMAAAIALLPDGPSSKGEQQRKSRLREVREGLTLGDLSIEELIAEGRE